MTYARVSRIVVLLVCVAGFYGCTSVTCAVGLKCLSDQDAAAIEEWLLCEECTDELDRVLNDIGWRSIRRFAGALERPPLHRTARYERQLRDDHRRSGSQLPESTYVATFLSNYVAQYQWRAAIALGELARKGGFGSRRAEDELRNALNLYESGARPYRDDVVIEIYRALNRATGVLFWAMVTTGNEHTCVLTRSADAFCWGNNDRGQLGNGTTDTATAPVPVSSGHTFASLATGLGVHTCGLRDSGYAYCWGNNDEGQLGDASYTSRLEPVAVGGDHPAVTVSVGGNHTCADTVTFSFRGNVCWGLNDERQLGLGIPFPPPDTSLPATVFAVVDLGSITLGQSHTCSIDPTGVVYCWGSNTDGQLGDGSTTNRDTPVPVAGSVAGFVAADAGRAHTCAVTSVGALYCWGRNTSGQLGDGTTTQRTSPTAIASAELFQAVAAGIGHTCAVTVSGVAYCWGDNADGQLGDGTVVQRQSPTPVSGGLTFASIDAGGAHTCGVTTTGEVYCWGAGVSGQLGTGTILSSSVPVIIVEPTSP